MSSYYSCEMGKDAERLHFKKCEWSFEGMCGSNRQIFSARNLSNYKGVRGLSTSILLWSLPIIWLKLSSHVWCKFVIPFIHRNCPWANSCLRGNWSSWNNQWVAKWSLHCWGCCAHAPGLASFGSFHRLLQGRSQQGQLQFVPVATENPNWNVLDY